MSDLQAHQMKLDKTFSTGAEEWFCPTCGRRFIMQWAPSFKRIVLNTGDEDAAHRGESANLRLGSMRPANVDEIVEHQRLSHWEAWLNSEDTRHWWQDDSEDLN